MTYQRWSDYEDRLLLALRREGRDFNYIADTIEAQTGGTRTAAACRSRWQKLVPAEKLSILKQTMAEAYMTGPAVPSEETDAFAEAIKDIDVPDGFMVDAAWIKDEGRSVLLRRTPDGDVPEGHELQGAWVRQGDGKYHYVREVPLGVPDLMEGVQQIWNDMIADIAKASECKPRSAPRPPIAVDADPHLLEVAVFDPHLGMLAWGKECGAPYDLEIGISDYAAAIDHALRHGTMYNVEKVLYIVGNDFFHVDTLAEGGKGATTTKGTMQDIDTRLGKMFTAGRRALTAGIEKARTIAPVDVLVVPGNHDQQTMYKMGEVLKAWFRHEEDVNVIYGPNKRKYYQYGNNLLGFTHGEEFKRKRDNLALIMPTECPPEMWAATTHREWHVGHNHIAMEKLYMAPVDTLYETRTVRVRSLPGLTPEDSWHYEEGYKHRRTGTALVFRRSGGIAGLHEFNIDS